MSIPRRWPDGASAEYVAARTKLMEAERALLAEVRRVAELRRELPLGAPMADYTFAEGEPEIGTTLADLVADRGLVVYHLMFAPDADEACPSCSMWVDGLHGVSHHIAQVTNFAVIAKAPLPKLLQWGRRRGWSGLRLLSSHGTTYNADVGAEDGDGNQWPGVSVYVRRDGVVHHSYSDGLMDNSLDLFTPVWHIEDVLPQGRGDWEPGNSYAGTHRGP